MFEEWFPWNSSEQLLSKPANHGMKIMFPCCKPYKFSFSFSENVVNCQLVDAQIQFGYQRMAERLLYFIYFEVAIHCCPYCTTPLAFLCSYPLMVSGQTKRDAAAAAVCVNVVRGQQTEKEEM